jgi:hypothetical protein
MRDTWLSGFKATYRNSLQSSEGCRRYFTSSITMFKGKFLLNLLHSGYSESRISISRDVFRFMARRVVGVMTGSYVWPFHSNSCSMTSLYGKGLGKVVLLRNVSLRRKPLMEKSSFLAARCEIFRFLFYIIIYNSGILQLISDFCHRHFLLIKR